MENENVVESSLEIFFSKHRDIYNQLNYAVAVSGGPDSMALAYALLGWAKKYPNKNIHILTVDHGLRVEAKQEAKAVKNWIDEQNIQNISHYTLSWKGKKPDTSLMEEARKARYDLIEDHCKENNIQTVFVAHHLDDQAETFLIRLAKGSGLDGLCGMKERRKVNQNFCIARPLLNVCKKDLMDYCYQNKISFFTDTSNENEKYLRPRLRKSMKVLEKEGLSVKRLSSLSRRLRRAHDALEEISAQEFRSAILEETDRLVVLDFNKIKNLTEEISFRVVHRAVKKLRIDRPYNVRMDRFESLFSSLLNMPEAFKPRTLGGLIFALKDKNSALYIEKEK